MKKPRDLSGEELAALLRRHGYQITRQTGSHLRLTSSVKGTDHHVTIPNHQSVSIGRLTAIVGDVTEYLGIDRQELMEELFRP